eukprot:366149-Chlamydomonas_euryale.AAC.12
MQPRLHVRWRGSGSGRARRCTRDCNVGGRGSHVGQYWWQKSRLVQCRRQRQRQSPWACTIAAWANRLTPKHKHISSSMQTRTRKSKPSRNRKIPSSLH